MPSADFQRAAGRAVVFFTVAVLIKGVSTAQCLFLPEQYVSVGNHPDSIITADFNGDGLVDLATANRFSDDVSVLLGIGDGTFGEAQNFATDIEDFEAIASGDFNGDDVVDLVALLYCCPHPVSVLLGVGDGTFGPPQLFPAEAGGVSITTGDFNGDGLIDLTFAGFTVPLVVVMLGNGDGTFGPEMNLTVEDDPNHVTTGDFNGDGVVDLGVSNSPYNHLSIYLGLGDGTFGTANSFPVGDTVRNATAGDFNGDGKLDLAVTTSNMGVLVLLGQGDGTF